MNNKIVAVIPAFNEEGTIGKIVSDTSKFVDAVVVIDDGSTDKTAEIAERNKAIVIRHLVNKGVGKSIIDGYAKALELNAEIIVQLDADGQHQPAEIPKLLNLIREGKADLVIGSRFIGKNNHMPVHRKLGNLFFTKLTNTLSKQKLTDTQSGFRAIRRQVLEKIYLQGSFTYVHELVLRAAKEGYKVSEVPISVASREQGKSKVVRNPITYGLRSLLIILRTLRDFHPFLFFGGIGSVLFLCGGLLGAYIMYMSFVLGVPSPVPRIIFSLLLTLVGIQLISFALFADALRSVKEEIKFSIRKR